MAKVIVPRGPLGLSAQRPVERESRVTGFWGGVLPVAGDEGQEHTFPLGQDIWLLSVHLKFWANTIGEQCSGWWFLSTGTKSPESALEVLTIWEPVIPCSSAIKPYFRWDGDEMEFNWTMNRRYKGSGRRFGLWYQNITAFRWWCHATFEIAEV